MEFFLNPGTEAKLKKEASQAGPCHCSASWALLSTEPAAPAYFVIQKQNARPQSNFMLSYLRNTRLSSTAIDLFSIPGHKRQEFASQYPRQHFVFSGFICV